MIKLMKILIVAAYFPPKNSIASLRPYSFAKYWAQNGHDVTVLAVPKYDFESDLILDCSQFKVIYAPLPRWHRFFVKESRSVQSSVGMSLAGTSGVLGRLKRGFLSWVYALRERTGVLKDQRFPSHLDPWFFSAYPTIRNEDWDLVVSTFSPYVGHFIAYRLRASGRAGFWIADYRDLWTGSHMFSGLPFIRSFERFLERRVNRMADCVTAVSQPLVDELKKNFDVKRAEVVENGFDLTDLKELPEENFFENEFINIVYTGNIYKGFRDPSPLFAVIRDLNTFGQAELLKRLRVLFVGKSDGGVAELARQYEVDWAVRHLGAVSRRQALHMQRDAHVLLFLESNRAEAAGVLTGKLFEYLNAGTEVWGIGVTSAVESGRLIVESGVGEAFGTDQERIKLALEGLLKNEKKKSVRVRPEVLRRYDREALAEKMLRLVEITTS